ncbi:hypothetical protein B0H19DRAFT_1153352 [Mycena capillaripes]|nr:hypothetical protein B0H19DRAFT_1153352 [Mycena capillaripes]
MVPLSRCKSPERRTGDQRRADLPHTFRIFLWRTFRDPDAPGAAEAAIQELTWDLLNCVPYSFDRRSSEYRDAVYSRDRFTLEYSERDFILLTDNFLEREHTAMTALMDEVEAMGRSPAHPMTWQDAETEEWTEDESPGPPPPPPSTGAMMRTDIECDSDSELGEPPELQPQPDSDSDSDSESGEVPDLDQWSSASSNDYDDCDGLYL